MEDIKKKLIEHDIRFDAHDARFDAHDKRFDAHDKRFDSIDEQIDFLARKMIEHDEDIKDIKSDLSETKQNVGKILHSMDDLTTYMKKHDEEITMHSHATQRLHDRDEEINTRITSLHPKAI